MNELLSKVNEGLGLPSLPPTYQPSQFDVYYDPKLIRPSLSVTKDGVQMNAVMNPDEKLFVYGEVDGTPAYCQIGSRVILDRCQNINFLNLGGRTDAS